MKLVNQKIIRTFASEIKFIYICERKTRTKTFFYIFILKYK